MAQRPAPSAQRPAPSAQRPAPSAQRPAPSAKQAEEDGKRFDLLHRYLTETGHTEETLKAWREFLALWLPKIQKRVAKRIRGPQEQERREDCSQDVVIKILQALLGSFDSSRDRFHQ